jgi:hypothetical protein
MSLRILPLSMKDAEAFLAKHDRHYKAPVEAICAIAVGEDQGGAGTGRGPKIHGAAILGRLDNQTAELAHIYVDGTSQGYSLLYGACWRALKALGYERTVL